MPEMRTRMELPEWFIERLYDLQQAVTINTGLAKTFSITITADLAMRVGIVPGEVVRIMGPAGIIQINAEKAAVAQCTHKFCELPHGHLGVHEFKLRVRT